MPRGAEGVQGAGSALQSVRAFPRCGMIGGCVSSVGEGRFHRFSSSFSRFLFVKMASPLSRLEQIPNELLLEVVWLLEPAGLANLLACSKNLHHRLLYELYRCLNRRVQAQRYACQSGNLDTLRQVIAHHVEAETAAHYWDCVGYGSVRPLYDAIRHGQLGVFQFLTARQNEARSPPGVDHAQFIHHITSCPSVRAMLVSELRDMMERICLPRNVEFLQAYLQSALVDMYRPYQTDEVILPLIPAIKAGAPLHLIRLLLDKGANPNHLRTLGHRSYICPLSAAIMADSIETCQLLLERGASIHGPNVSASHSTPKVARLRALFHIPVFAAACQLPKTGTAMLQFCLDHGANINQVECRLGSNSRPQVLVNKCWVLPMTPLDAFIESVESWGSQFAHPPVQGLTYMLLCGALSAGHLSQSDLPVLIPHAYYHIQWYRNSDLLGRLLRRFRTWALTEPAFRDTVKRLAETPGIGDHFVFHGGDVILNGAYKKGTDWQFLVREEEGWRDLLTSWMGNPQVGPTRFLGLLTGTNQECDECMPWDIIRFLPRNGAVGHRVPGHLYFVAVHLAISHGADVNEPDAHAGQPPLHRLCSGFRRDLGEQGICMKNSDILGAVVKAVRHLFTLLIWAGADTQLRDREGKTPLQHLDSKPEDEKAKAALMPVSRVIEGLEVEEDYRWGEVSSSQQGASQSSSVHGNGVVGSLDAILHNVFLST